MPANFSRVEVHFSPELREKLDKLKQEMRKKTGKKVTRSKIVEKIVEQFFEKAGCFSSQEE